MPVDQAEILKEAVETLRADATLIALLGEIEGQPGEARVWNHVPQDESKPYIVVSWQPDEDWDTKDSRGFDGSLDHEAVSTHHGDRNVLRIADAVIAAYTANPLVLASGRIVCFDYQSGSVPVQVFETHQIAFSFNVLVDADGLGGAPIPDPLGAAIIVQDEGVDLPNTPHKKLNFVGAGVDAVDAGGDVADITIPGGGGGGPGFVEVVATHTVAEGNPKTLVTIPINALTGVLLSVFAAGYDIGQNGGVALVQHQAFHRIAALQKNTGATALSDDSAGGGAQLNLVVSGNNILIQSVIISDITWKINYLLITAP